MALLHTHTHTHKKNKKQNKSIFSYLLLIKIMKIESSICIKITDFAFLFSFFAIR
jgi:hypothetical protein